MYSGYLFTNIKIISKKTIKKQATFQQEIDGIYDFFDTETLGFEFLLVKMKDLCSC